MSRLSLLGANIAKYRKTKGLTQVNLAVKLGLSYEYICRVERGQKYMSLRKLFELADILGVKFSDITNFD
ncbi:MAG: helix-turn-helix transcriptional regulator [Candidatus Gastranaerophilaceae bacterium]|nr:helix-turn-helix transcriptional regulator [Candidatus Gastranaerophilaceae bacterium]